MFTESGTLPIGIHLLGEDCRAYTLRPLKVKDSIEVRRGPDASRCEGDDELMGLALLGRRLTIDGIPPEAMTLDFMLNLFDDDLAEVLEADRRLSEELARFRGEDPQATGAGAPAPENSLGDGPGDGPGGGPGVAGGLGGGQESEEGAGGDAPGAAPP